MAKVIPRPDPQDIPIPGTLNLIICALAFSAAAGLLWAVAHVENWGLKFALAVVFGYVGNTIFSMLHEAVHRVAHPVKWVNETIGLFCAAFFPTGFTFQRFCHLGHHRRNRTDVEMFDMYYPRDNWYLKALQLYGILLGLYWPMLPLGCLLYLFFPWALNTQWLRNTKSYEIKHIGADAMIAPLFAANAPKFRMRAEMLFSLGLQLTLFRALDLSFASWLLCYYVFGFNWGSLQYADHAGSARDIRHGAWNLRVNKFTRAMFLNYHHHLVHHQHPQIPWIHLGKFVDPDEPRPTFMEKYLELWRGPKLTTEPPPRDVDPDFAFLIDFGDSRLSQSRAQD
jgi:fatty acid desaturase